MEQTSERGLICYTVNDKDYDNQLFVDVAGNDDYGVVAHTGNQGAATAAIAL